MSRTRKPLDEIMNKFESNEKNTNLPTEAVETSTATTPPPTDSLTASLAMPKKKVTKIRFTLDLDKPLDERLSKSAKYLNRSKADLARIALERLLDELEREWNQ